MIESTVDCPLIKRADAFAEEAHRDQLRKTGEPYITHPRRVAGLVREYVSPEVPYFEELQAAALLHDVVEDCGVRLEEIEEEFGQEVQTIVALVTNLTFNEKLPRHLRTVVKHVLMEKRRQECSLGKYATTLKALDRIHNLICCRTSELLDFAALQLLESEHLFKVVENSILTGPLKLSFDQILVRFRVEIDLTHRYLISTFQEQYPDGVKLAAKKSN